PALLRPGYRPAYGYVSARAGEQEAHTGFKSYAFTDEQGHRWLVTHHFGTGGLARACARFHAVDVAAVDTGSGALLADLHFMGDFGKAAVNTTGLPLTPPMCPSQAAVADADQSLGVRLLPSLADGSVGYEP